MAPHRRNGGGRRWQKRRFPSRLIVTCLFSLVALLVSRSLLVTHPLNWGVNNEELTFLPDILGAITGSRAAGRDEDDVWTTSPLASMMSNFQNPAIEQAVRRHDRLIIDGLTFINKFDAKGYLARAGVESSQLSKGGKKFTIVVLTRNRPLPYVVALISLLLQGHGEAEFVEMLDVAICNVERRPGWKEKYFLFDDLRRRLSSIMTFYDWSNGAITTGTMNEDYIRALELCKERNGKWCVILADDTVPALGLAQILTKAASTEGSARLIRLNSANDAPAGSENQGATSEQKFRELDCDAGGKEERRNTLADAISSEIVDDLIGFLCNNPHWKGGSETEIPYCQFQQKGSFGRNTIIQMTPSVVDNVGLFSASTDNPGGRSCHNSVDAIRDPTPMDPLFELKGENDKPNSRSPEDYQGTKPFGVYPSEAVRREVEKHDRYVIDSMLYMDAFGRKQASNFMKRNPSVSKSEPGGRICVVIFTINRSIPYILVLLSVLLRGHKSNVTRHELDVHVINIEQRPNRLPYHLFDHLKDKLPFIQFRDWSQPYKETLQFQDQSDKFYYANQKINYLKALQLCKENGSSWCLFLEEDALPTVDFISKFRALVDKQVYNVSTYTPLIVRELGEEVEGKEKGNILGKKKQPAQEKRVINDEISAVPSEEIGIVKLYFDGPGRKPFNPKFIKFYQRETPLDLYEAAAEKVVVKRTEYNMVWSGQNKGAVADCYPRAILDAVIAHVANHTALVGSDRATWPFDAQVNNDFLHIAHLKSISIAPSLVNHLGMVSENLGSAGIDPYRISTDISFSLDDGSAYKLS